jgi:hypothetical protein
MPSSLSKNLQSALSLMTETRDEIPDANVEALKNLSEAIGFMNCLVTLYQGDESDEENRLVNYLIEQNAQAKAWIEENRKKEANLKK